MNAVAKANRPNPPESTFRKIPTHNVNRLRGPQCMKFLAPASDDTTGITNLLLLCFPCGSVFLYNLTATASTLRWKFQADEAVLCVTPLAANWILLGGAHGTILQLDWQHTTRKAFSSELSPRIVRVWNTRSMLARKNARSMLFETRTVPTEPSWMGIRALSVETEEKELLQMRDLQTMGSCRVYWTTACGWTCYMDLHGDSGRRAKIHLLHCPSNIITKTNGGGEVTSTHVSFPSKPVAVASAPNALLWQSVPPITHVLPHHDQRVLEPQRQVLVSSERQLLLLNHGGGSDLKMSLTPIPLKQYMELTTMVMHPSCEWIVVGSDTDPRRFVIYNARRRPGRRSGKKMDSTSSSGGI